MFLQIHYLAQYPPSLLNRDDAGFAKRIMFGGAPRLRVSSQAQKRRWRVWMRDRTLLPHAERTRHFFARLQAELEAEGVSPDVAEVLVAQLYHALFPPKKKNKGSAKDAENTNAPLVLPPVDKIPPLLFGRPEHDYLLSLVLAAARAADPAAALSATLERQKKTPKNNLTTLLAAAGYPDLAVGYDGALFGRFVPSEVILSRVDAPVHVAHAFTVHALDTEADYFTAVDDLAPDSGAATVQSMELGAGLYYGYVVIDVPLLVSNLTGCARDAWRSAPADDARALITLLVQAITEVTVGAKLGATAPYTRPETVVLEAGTAQPRSLANAFLEPLDLGPAQNPQVQAATALDRHVRNLTALYGPDDVVRQVATTAPWSVPAEQGTLPEAVATVLHTVWPA